MAVVRARSSIDPEEELEPGAGESGAVRAQELGGAPGTAEPWGKNCLL